MHQRWSSTNCRLQYIARDLDRVEQHLVTITREGVEVEPETGRNLVEDARRVLSQCLLFRGLGSDDRGKLVARARIRNFAAGEAIFLMGSPGDNMMAVLSGTVRISVSTPEGRELVLAILMPGEVFGEIALLDGKERTADATAMTACSVAILDRREILAFFERHPGAWPNIIDVLCDRLRKTDEHIAEVALLQLPARLAKALLRVAAAKGDPKTENERGQIQLSQRELGNIVGAARETVNKCLRIWQDDGIIGIQGGLITIRDRAALEELAEGG
jgi:CRP/FNR family transcriptional regulator, cyclic AMP receptor protein